MYVDTPPSSNPSYPNPGCMSGPASDIYIPISVKKLGPQRITTTFDPGPVKCQATFLGATYTAHVSTTCTYQACTTASAYDR